MQENCYLRLMNRLPANKRKQIISMLVEATSLLSTSRIADVSINTVTKLLLDTGKACQQFHNETIIKLQSQNVKCEEICPFNRENVSTYTALDTDSKLIISWLVGNRDENATTAFLRDVAARVVKCPKFMSDVSAYLNADIIASFEEPCSLTERIYMRKHNSLSKAFYRKIETHCYAIALHVVYYNFAKIHPTLGVTPAMNAGITKSPMTIEDIVNLEPFNAPKR